MPSKPIDQSEKAPHKKPGDPALASSSRWVIFSYLGGLMSISALGDPTNGLMDVPLSFILKNEFHLTAHELSRFRLIAGVPLYLSFIFGLIRDSWSPFRMGDRGYVLIFGFGSALIYIAFALTPTTVTVLTIAEVLLTSASLFVASAQNGLASTVGRQYAITGQISTAWNIFTALPTIAVFFAGGWLSQLLEGENATASTRSLFFVGAAGSLLLSCYALLRPNEVYARQHDELAPPFPKAASFWRHRPIYPALLIWLLWNFSPGSVTPLQYHLQNALKGADWQWGEWNAIFTASFIPTFIIFGLLCRRVSLRGLLWWGTIAAIPQFVPFLFVNSAQTATIAAIPAGLMGGVATAAYLDLIIRSAPRGLEGTMLMAASAIYFVATRFGDIIGSYLYDYFGGFSVCVLVTTVCYALILLVIQTVEAQLINSTDGEFDPVRYDC